MSGAYLGLRPQCETLNIILTQYSNETEFPPDLERKGTERCSSLGSKRWEGELFWPIVQALQGHAGSCFLQAGILVALAETSLERWLCWLPMLPPCCQPPLGSAFLPPASLKHLLLSSGCCLGWAPQAFHISQASHHLLRGLSVITYLLSLGHASVPCLHHFVPEQVAVTLTKRWSLSQREHETCWILQLGEVVSNHRKREEASRPARNQQTSSLFLCPSE